MSEPEVTPELVMRGIIEALRDRDFTVIPGLIKLLAILDAHLAQDVLDTFDLAQMIARTDG